jgi:hypothetical protein
MSLVTALFCTRGTISRTQVWLTAFGVQFAMLLIPSSRVVQIEHVKRMVWIGTVEGPCFHFAAPATIGDLIALAIQCAAWTIVFWALVAALWRRLNAHGRSPYWLFVLLAFFGVVEAEIIASPGPHFSWIGLVCVVAFIPIVVFMAWGMIDIFFRRSAYETDLTDAPGDMRKVAPVNGTPAP